MNSTVLLQVPVAECIAAQCATWHRMMCEARTVCVAWRDAADRVAEREVARVLARTHERMSRYWSEQRDYQQLRPCPECGTPQFRSGINSTAKYKLRVQQSVPTGLPCTTCYNHNSSVAHSAARMAEFQRTAPNLFVDISDGAFEEMAVPLHVPRTLRWPHHAVWPPPSPARLEALARAYFRSSVALARANAPRQDSFAAPCDMIATVFRARWRLDELVDDDARRKVTRCEERNTLTREWATSGRFQLLDWVPIDAALVSPGGTVVLLCVNPANAHFYGRTVLITHRSLAPIEHKTGFSVFRIQCLRLNPDFR